MIIINNLEKIKELKNISANDCYILADFDGTITDSNGDSSWSSIFKSNSLNPKFVNACIKLYQQYHPFEIDNQLPYDQKMSLLNEWYRKNIETLIKYRISADIINNTNSNHETIKLRTGAKTFLENMYHLQIPVIIISAGVGNIIQNILRQNNILYPNIYVISNILKYENQIVCGVENKNLIHPLNKNKASFPPYLQEIVKNRQNIILLGDSPLDINMASNTPNKTIYSIGFLDEEIPKRLIDYNKIYDIVCTENTSYDDLIHKLSKTISFPTKIK